jgi:hypothetical protein
VATRADYNADVAHRRHRPPDAALLSEPAIWKAESKELEPAAVEGDAERNCVQASMKVCGLCGSPSGPPRLAVLSPPIAPAWMFVRARPGRLSALSVP